MMNDGDIFWVAELTEAFTGNAMGGIYWNGHTRPVFDPVTTMDIHEALKYKNAEACQRDIDKLDQCKSGILRPVEHAWIR